MLLHSNKAENNIRETKIARGRHFEVLGNSRNVATAFGDRLQRTWQPKMACQGCTGCTTTQAVKAGTLRDREADCGGQRVGERSLCPPVEAVGSPLVL